MGLSSRIQDFLDKVWMSDEHKKAKTNKWMWIAGVAMFVFISVSASINFIIGNIALIPFIVLAVITFSYVMAVTGLAAAWTPEGHKYDWTHPIQSFKLFWNDNKMMIYFAAFGATLVGANVTGLGGGITGNFVIFGLAVVGFFVFLRKEHTAILAATIIGMVGAVILSGVGFIPGGAIGLAAALGYIVPFNYWAGLEVEMLLGSDANKDNKPEAAVGKQGPATLEQPPAQAEKNPSLPWWSWNRWTHTGGEDQANAGDANDDNTKKGSPPR